MAKIELTPDQEDEVIRQELEWLVNFEPPDTEDVEEWRKMADAARILLAYYGYPQE